MTIAGANYREGVAFDSNGAMYVTLSGGTDVAVADGGTGSSTAQGAAANLQVPFIVAQTAIPFIHLSSGSVAANGAISAITALPVAYAQAYCYFPANILATTIAAGWYYCTFSTTTAGVAFLNTYISGIPAVPASPTAVTDGKGAFTGDTTERAAHTLTVPANAMGANGSLRVSVLYAATPSNANAKTARVRFSGSAGTVFGSLAMASSLFGAYKCEIANRGATNSQVGTASALVGGDGVTGSASTVYSAVDTTAATTIVASFQKGTATDNAVVERVLVELLVNS